MFLALLVRLGLLLSATPVGGMTPEILYLRAASFRGLVRIVVLLLVLEGAQFLLPALADLGALRAEWVEPASPLIDLAQAALLVAAAALALRAFAPYSRRSLADLDAWARRSFERAAGRVARGRGGAGGPGSGP